MWENLEKSDVTGGEAALSKHGTEGAAENSNKRAGASEYMRRTNEHDHSSTPHVLRLSGESLDELGRLHDFFDQLGREANWSERLKMDLLLCCEELLTNTISYGYPDRQDRVSRSVEAVVTHDSNCVTIELSDNATPYNPLMQQDPDLTLGVEERPIGGLGVFFVKTIMDEVRYESTGSGNKLILRKFIDPT